MEMRKETGERKNRMDAETAEFYSRVREAYLGIAERRPERFRIVDASGSIAEIHAAVVDVVDELLD